MRQRLKQSEWFALLAFSLLINAPLIQAQNPEKPSAVAPLLHAYDYRLIDRHGQSLDLDTLVEQLLDYDVIFIGEFHGNNASHLLQMQLQSALYQKRPQQILSLEMFNRDQQAILNRYIDDEIGEKYLVNEAPAWPNYTGSYRPMIEFAKAHFLPVIAANASANIVRCIGQIGEDYPQRLPPSERIWLAKQPFLNDAAYEEKFTQLMKTMRSQPGDQIAKAYAAQLARDNTMAESILQGLKNHPNHQLLHLNGTFHSESHLGTVALLKARHPNLKVAVITPLQQENPQQPTWQASDLALGDYLYLLMPQPVEFRGAQYRLKLQKKRFENAKQKAQECQ
ncbi:MAG: ChaN family lipoprotein [Thiotrichales bacterium]|nr:ChaN family lipoprotein [Thiotrichales bacterium]